jgi:integrase
MVKLTKENIKGVEDLSSGHSSFRPNTNDWLQGLFEDDCWEIIPSTKGYDISHYTISWEYPFAKGIVDWSSYWIYLAKTTAYHCMESEKVNCKLRTSLVCYTREIRSFCFWMCSERKCSNITLVTSSDIQAYEQYLKELELVINTVVTKLGIVKVFWTLREEIGGGLTFDPYIKNNSMGRKAKNIGVKQGNTPTIPPRDLFSIINTSLDKLNRSKEVISNLDIYIELKAKYSKSHFTRLFESETGIKTEDFLQKLGSLYCSSIIIVLILTGERKHEIHHTKYSDVLALFDSDDDIELLGRLTKTAGTSTGHRTARPVIRELKLAFKIIIALTSHLRKGYDGDALLLKLPTRKDAYEGSPELTQRVLYTLLNNFYNEKVYTKIEKLRPHMFRKAFSLMWAWRFEVGDLHSLSKMLFHNNENFTKTYTESDDFLEFLPEAYRELLYDTLERSLIGEEVVHGKVGKALKRYSSILKSLVTVITPEAVHQFVTSLIKKREYALIPQSDGFCLIDRERQKYAKCSTDGKTPNYANRNEKLCFSCMNFGVTETRKSVWEQRLSSHKRVFYSTDVGMLKQSSLEGIERAEKVIQWIEAGTDD